MARLKANYGVANVERYTVEVDAGGVERNKRLGERFSQLKTGVVEDGAVLVLVAADVNRQIKVKEKLAEEQPVRLESATPARVLLADGSLVLIQHAGCGCGSPLKAMDVVSVYEENL